MTLPARVIGGGISGLACAGALNAAGIEVVLSDRGRALGGRMASRTIRNSGTAFDGHVTDIGASYFTAHDPEFRTEVDRWVDAGIARPWTDTFHIAEPDGIVGVKAGPMRFTATGGLRSIVQALAAELENTQIRHEDVVASVSRDGAQVRVDDSDVAAAALCLPGPQAQGLLDESLSPLRSAAAEAMWEPVIAVIAVFDAATWPDFDGVFVNDDPVLTWIANDGSRRGDGAPVLVAHVHPVLAARHLQSPTDVLPAAIAGMRRVLGIAEQPAWTDVQRWTYARPLAAVDAPFALMDEAPIGIAGDAWAAGPRIEAAWRSGRALGRALGHDLERR